MARYDMTIIGGGSGGLTAARIASSLGASVLLVDKESLGGDCLRYGCVPSKSLIHVARMVHQAKGVAKLGLVSADVQVDMARVSRYVQDVISRVSETEKVYTEHVTVRFGEVTFAAPRVLRLDGEEIRSRTTVIATGSHPAIPQVEGLQETGFMTNMDVFDLTQLPASIIIVGGGPIGVELGQAFARLGTTVTIIQGPERILPREDPEVSAAVAGVLACEGVTIVTGARFVKASRSGSKKIVTARQGEQLVSFEADEIVLALGRQPNVEGLGLEAVGIAYDAHGIKVNPYLQTSASDVFAIGDVTGGYLFTHVAAYQAKIAVRNALVPVGRKKADYRVVPWCTFSDPEAARIGLTPDEARKQHKLVRIVKLPWADIDRAQTEGETAGFMKLVLAGKKDEIVGVHLVGARAGELLGELALAMQQKLTLNDIFGTIHAYPTMNMGVQQVAAEAYLQGGQVASNRRIVRTLLNFRK
ncbi:MAG: FAD-dependent oxidoreductase [Ktedonobacteraceae bacterium]|nr:FAD-dependent oxidoreductase [Ktedonobacteraceae bacterium]